MHFLNKTLIPITKIIAALIFISLNGCAVIHNMESDTGGKELNLNGNGMLLMTLEFSNAIRPALEAIKNQEISVLIVETQNPKTLNIQMHSFVPDKSGIFEHRHHTTYAFRMALPEGQYRIKAAVVNRKPGFLETVTALGLLPLMLDVNVEGNKVTYIGNIAATIREREKNEPRVSHLFLIPDIDNVRAGFHSGTFEVAVRDKFEEEMVWYKETYSALQNVEIYKQILPNYDYQKAKEWVEASSGMITHPAYPHTQIDEKDFGLNGKP
jgi:hypothetical protein